MCGCKVSYAAAALAVIGQSAGSGKVATRAGSITGTYKMKLPVSTMPAYPQGAYASPCKV